MSTIFSDHCEEGYSDYAKYASVIHSTLLKSRWPYYKSLLGLLKDLSFTGELTLIFNDLPGNNYNVLEKKVRSLERECMHVYLLMNACDMYKRCLPRNTLDIGLSTFTLQLLSKASVENGVGWNTASEAERNAMAKEAAEQWKLFLSQRCEEMTIGGFLIIRFVNLEQLRKAVENAFVDIYKDGWITQEEFRNINVPFYYMDKKEILEPFEYKYFAPNMRLVDVHILEIPVSTKNDVLGLPCKPWMKNSLLSGLSSKRSNLNQEDIFNNLYTRFEERCTDITVCIFKVIEVIIQRFE